jgi:four helix bundle protein
MRTRNFRELQVWQRSMGMAKQIYAATRAFPTGEGFGPTSRIRRSTVSIPGNAGEGQGKGSDRSFALFLTQARGSLCELESQLEITRDLGLIEAARATALLNECGETGRSC